ncbi:MAG: hypothetical protein RSD27_07520 [Ruthenibacterium sp.]
MQTITGDTKLLHELEFLWRNDPRVFFSIKRNVTAAYEMDLATNAERAFQEALASDPQFNQNAAADAASLYECYSLDAQHEAIFKAYCRMKSAVGTPYLFLRTDNQFCAVYCVNDAGYITHRKLVFSSAEIQDILWSFKAQMHACKPAQPNDATNFTVMKGRIAV